MLSPGRGLFGIVTVALLCVMLFMMFNSTLPGEKVSLNQFERDYEAKQLKLDSIVIRDDGVYAEKLPDPANRTPRYVTVPFNTATREQTVARIQELTDGRYQSKSAPAWTPLLMWWLPLILVFVVLWMIISRGLRSAGGGGGMLGNFGKSRHRTLTKEMTNVTFSDVAGIDEAKEEVTEIIEFLKNPKKFTKLGGRIPRGVLLVGEPGCGKTLLAKAIAGEADVPFFSISGSDFVEMFVGVGASRVRDLFKQAKDSSPCIVFLDEIDAVGRRRGGGFSHGGHDEREQTLNAILVEMDGFSPADGVIVIAATNRSDVLDPALIRPGRFDRQVVVPLPDVKGRLEILRVHSKKVKLDGTVDLERLARGTPMFSGADLAAIINEAAIGATMQNKESVEQTDLEEARDKIRFGRARKSRRIDKDENRATAYHEAGHAVLQYLLKDADPLHKVTIIPRGMALGATFSLPEKDRLGYSLRYLAATMRVLCGGRLAEERAVGDISSGASMDITQVTRFARAMVLDWGMSERLGFVRYSGEDSRESFVGEKEYSDVTARIIDEEIKRLVSEAYEDARRLLEANWDKVASVAEALLKHETLSLDDVDQLMKGNVLTRPTVAEMLRAEERKRSETNPPASPTKPESDLPPDALPTPA
jgi:cell division protease FtsH